MHPMMCEKRGAITRYTDSLETARHLIARLKAVTEIARMSDLQIQSQDTLVNFIHVVGGLSDEADVQFDIILNQFSEIMELARED